MDSKQSEIAAYYLLLDEFVAECHALVDSGQAYGAVLLCHELYRFLYPVEPFAGFEHDAPIEFCTDHIRRLVASSRVLREGISPYQPRPSRSGRIDGCRSLEVATSDLYSDLWRGFRDEELTCESVALLEGRLPRRVLAEFVVGKRVLDMGCGSGRYAVALAKLGAARVDAIDVQAKAYSSARRVAEELGLGVVFHEGSVHALPFEDSSFDFVFCNGVLHHTSSIEKGISELGRVLRLDGAGFLHLYGAGGIFWNTRRALRVVFARIPLEYTKIMLGLMGMPQNRFVFCDTWYVPIESHTTTDELHRLLGFAGLGYRKLHGRNPFDLDREDLCRSSWYGAMWGNGEHRYLVRKSPVEALS